MKRYFGVQTGLVAQRAFYRTNIDSVLSFCNVREWYITWRIWAIGAKGGRTHEPTRIAVLHAQDGRLNLDMSPIFEASSEAGVRAQAVEHVSFAMYYLVDGSATFGYAYGDVAASPGDLLIAFPRDSLRIHNETRNSGFHCHFSSTSVPTRVFESGTSEWSAMVEQLSNAPTGTGEALYLPNRIHIPDRDQVGGMFADLLRAQRGKAPGRAVEVRARFLLLLAFVSRVTGQVLTADTADRNPDRAGQHFVRAVDFIETEVCWAGPNRIGPSDVAAHVGVSLRYLNRIFADRSGASVGACLLRQRMKIARDMLRHGTMSIKSVAYEVGFADPLYFSRMFRRETGMSPREFSRMGRRGEHKVKGERPSNGGGTPTR